MLEQTRAVQFPERIPCRGRVRLCATALFFLVAGTTWAADERREPVAPIRIAAKAKTEQDFAKAQDAWAERALIAPFRERAKNQTWMEAATDFARKAIDEWPCSDSSGKIPPLAAEGAALLARGCEDPLIGYFATWARWHATDEYYGSRESFNKWRKAAEKIPGQSALARMATVDFLRTNFTVQIGAEDAPKKYAELAATAWKDGSYLSTLR